MVKVGRNKLAGRGLERKRLMLAGWQRRGNASGFQGKRNCEQKGTRMENENPPGGGGRIKFWEGGDLARDDFLSLAGGLADFLSWGSENFFGVE